MSTWYVRALSLWILGFSAWACSHGSKESQDAMHVVETGSADSELPREDSSYQPDADSEEGCVGSCETKFGWPRVIVGFFPSDSATSSWLVTGRSEDGAVQPGIRSGCPAGVLTVPCSFSLPAMVSTKEMTVVVEDPTSGKVAQLTVTLPPFNRCGREITYLRASPDGNGGIILGTPEVISPCSP